MGIEANTTTYNEFIQALGGSLDKIVELTRDSEHSLDISELSTEELQNALRDAIEDVGQEVLVAWPADHAAARTTYRDALERVDDLWYPSMDDLVILDNREEARHIIILDHEERLFSATHTT
ncbi:hypothetical protein [Streptomyces naphthomycinicus]|uniref:hypothetical protein n=1 Tax=Streptomyces naphthomycinicus TaxID=2872625 RepID=UPI001CECEC6A|nr:hypothetical protein [Streptomyces sp. TML10]